MRWLLAHTPGGAVNVSWRSVSSDTIDNMATTKIALFGTFVTYFEFLTGLFRDGC